MQTGELIPSITSFSPPIWRHNIETAHRVIWAMLDLDIEDYLHVDRHASEAVLASIRLIVTNESHSSPFVLAIKTAGIKGLPDLLNAVLLICVCSVGSTSIYISSRTLQAMAEDGFAFKFLRKTDGRGRPVYALIFTMAIATILAYLNASSTGAEVFSW